MTTIERTAPRRPEDCPTPRSERTPWERVEGRPAEDFFDPRQALAAAEMMRYDADCLHEAAVLRLLAEGLSIAAAAEVADTSAERVQEISDHERHTRDRRDYSAAYYARHPERVPDQWYPVEDGDPELPDYSSFSTKTRPITERADAR